MIDDGHRLRTSRQKDDAADEHFDDPDQTSLSPLPALRLKSVRTDSNCGRIVAEQMVANNPQKDIVYRLVMLYACRQLGKEPKALRGNRR
jgi:hypothetical protein